MLGITLTQCQRNTNFLVKSVKVPLGFRRPRAFVPHVRRFHTIGVLHQQNRFTLPEIEQAKDHIKNENWIKALPLLHRGLEVCKQMMGPLDPSTLELMETEAKLYSKQDLKKALPVLSQLRSLYKEKDHIHYLRMTENLIVAQRIIGNYENAIQIAQEMRQFVDENKPFDDTVNISYVIKSLLHKSGNLMFAGKQDEFQEILQECLNLAKTNLPQDHPVKAQVLYHQSQYISVPSNHLEEALHSYQEASTILEHSPSTPFLPEHSQKLLLARIYDGITEIYLKQSNFRDSEKFGKMSLDITNKLVSRDTKLVEWCLHLMSETMVGLQNFFYAEGLFRRLEGLVGGDLRVKRRPYVVQVESLRRYCEMLKKFHRKSEAEGIQKMLDEVKECRPTYEMHALFEEFDWRV